MKLLLKALLMFALVQIVALFMGANFVSAGVSVVAEPGNVSNSFYFFGSVIAMAVLLLLILKFYKGNLLFLGLEILMEFIAVQLFAALFLPEILTYIIAAAAITARMKFEQVRQPLLLFATAVVGGLLGASLQLIPSLLLAFLLAGYDVIAVFYTKHMVILAQGLSKRSAGFTMKVKEGKHKLELGTGDIVIPAMLASSANQIGKEFVIGSWIFTLPGFAAVVFSILGMYAMLLYLQKKKGFFPALPPLVGASAIGIGLALLF